jgi:hypothetical protein
MTLDLYLDVGDRRDLMASVPVKESLLSDDLPAKLGVHAPTWQLLADKAFEDPQLTPEQAIALGAEVRLLREAWMAQQRDTVAAEHRVRAKDWATRQRIIDRLVATVADPVRETLDGLIGLCDAAMTRGKGIIGVSD